jgi:hypothetical protein
MQTTIMEMGEPPSVQSAGTRRIGHRTTVYRVYLEVTGIASGTYEIVGLPPVRVVDETRPTDMSPPVSTPSPIIGKEALADPTQAAP